MGAGWKRRLGTFQKWKPDELFKGEHILQAAPLLELVRQRRQLRSRPQPRPDGADTDNCIRRTRLFSIKRSCWRHNRGSGTATSGLARAPCPPPGAPRAHSFFRAQLIDVWLPCGSKEKAELKSTSTGNEAAPPPPGSVSGDPAGTTVQLATGDEGTLALQNPFLCCLDSEYKVSRRCLRKGLGTQPWSFCGRN